MGWDPARQGEYTRRMDLAAPHTDRRTAHQMVRDALRQAILVGRIDGGARLVQAEIAKQMQVSTTPVREALRDLATEGLITLDAHRGAVVRTMSRAEFDEVYRIRQLLEPELMQHAIANMTDDELAEAERIQALAEVEEDPITWVDLNRQFHTVFAEAARRPRLAGIIETLQGSVAMYIVASLVHGEKRQDHANSQHRELLEAARDRDVDRAVALITDHIHATIDSMPALEDD